MLALLELADPPADFDSICNIDYLNDVIQVVLVEEVIQDYYFLVIILLVLGLIIFLS